MKESSCATLDEPTLEIVPPIVSIKSVSDEKFGTNWNCNSVLSVFKANLIESIPLTYLVAPTKYANPSINVEFLE